MKISEAALITSVSMAKLKKLVNGKQAKFVAQGVGDEVPFEKIYEILETQQDQPYSTISFNAVDMLRTLEDGEISHCGLKGRKAFMSDKGFVMVAPWGTQVNVMVYQF